MKKGFALLETLIVITFLCVSLLMLYSTFTNMVNNTKKNILFDDASNIYKAYYLKEYLTINDLDNVFDNSDIKEITCEDFNFISCQNLLKEMNINKLYVTKYDLKNYNKDNYPSYFNNYIDTLSNKDNLKYRLILEFVNNDIYSYSSIAIGGDVHE